MNGIVVKCLSCGALNRADFSNELKKPRCGKCKADLKKNPVPFDVTLNSFDNEVIKHQGFVLVDLWSPTCGYCRQLSPILDRLAAASGESLKIVKINVDAEGTLASRFDVRGVPMMILYKNGNKIDELAGFLPEVQLNQWLRERGL